jgi:RNA polymerase sigma-70 factor (ECF subfamily)
LCDEEEAKDVVQESFIRVWKHISNFSLKSKFTTWLYKIVVNLCYDKMKSQKRKKAVLIRNFDKEMLDLAPYPENIEEELINKELAGLIRNIADELSTKQRIVFILRDLQDLKISEVSQILNMPESSVKTNLYHARLNIRKKLEQIENKKLKSHGM